MSGLKADLRSGRYLSGEIEVVLGHHGDDGISPRQGMIREQQHRLAIVRHVATNHGGEVSVSSVEGEGSTFVLKVPAAPGLVMTSMSEAG